MQGRKKITKKYRFILFIFFLLNCGILGHFQKHDHTRTRFPNPWKIEIEKCKKNLVYMKAILKVLSYQNLNFH